MVPCRYCAVVPCASLSCDEFSGVKFLPHQYILLLLQLSAVSICVRSPE